jgi:predicted AAA+ superfamily ATPase
VTIAHYLRLLAAAGMVMGIEKYSGSTVRQRASSPKLQVLNNALATAMLGDDPRTLLADPETRGRLTESAVGAHLANAAAVGECTLHYWRERDLEVDFVVEKGRRLLAIEVKSGRKREGVPGIGAFCKAYPAARPLLVGTGGIAVEEFLGSPVGRWMR